MTHKMYGVKVPGDLVVRDNNVGIVIASEILPTPKLETAPGIHTIRLDGEEWTKILLIDFPDDQMRLKIWNLTGGIFKVICRIKQNNTITLT